MSTARVQVRLRPIRFGFLVSPGDAGSIRKVFEANTCLWGGKYNPIIPVFSRRPQWWDRHRVGGETAEQILNGYLDYFEPDILVETRAGQAAPLGFSEERVIGIDQLLARRDLDTESLEACGQTVYPLYQELFKAEFQFAKREPQKVVHVTAGASPLASMCACIFGAFPQFGTLHDLERVFDQVFEPQNLILTSENVEEIFRNNWMNPLHVTPMPTQPYSYLTAARDLIDYWNLRAGVQQVLPIPVQFAQQLSPLCKSFVERNYRPLPGNRHGVMIRPKVMFSRSIPLDAIASIFGSYFRVDIEGANCVQDWYPPIWRSSPEIVVSPSRPRVTAKERSYDVVMEGESPTLRFDSLAPSFSQRYGGRNRWANVVELSDWSFSNQLATTYPNDYRNPKLPNFGGPIGRILPTTEGFVALQDYSELPHYWTLESNAAAIARWLKNRDIDASLSTSGRATQQIIQTLGGFGGVSALANADIVNLLNAISRKPISRSMEHHQFRNRINAAVSDGIWNKGAFHRLVERNAVEVGLEVRCEKCGSWTWYALSELDSLLKCQLCLKAFPFPASNPTANEKTRWAYRLIGPFAQPNFAQGGYAAALSIRFFAHVLQWGDRPGATWCAGQEMTLPGGMSVEADYILWYKRKQTLGNDYPTQLVFGEAKSFGKDVFTAGDIERTKKLARAFPGAILVFSTMKLAADLSADEVKRLAVLAEWGRKYETARRQTRAPVIILTGTELFTEYSLPEAWKKAGGKHAELMGPAYVRPDNLRKLADLTQQLYLGLEPYGAAMMKRFERRRASTQLESGKSVI